MDKFSPPELPFRLFEWFCKPEYYLDIEGDLLELFDRRVESVGVKKARRLLWKDILFLLRPGIISPLNFLNHLKPNLMYKEHIKIALRHMLKQKRFTAIKIGGFAVGIAACLLIALFIRDELSYDTHFSQADQVYRFIGVDKETGEDEKWPSFPAPIGSVLGNDFPEIEKVGRLIPYDWYDAGNNQFRPVEDPQNTYEEGFVYADPELLEILDVPMVYGDQETALAEPHTLVISHKISNKYFPNEDPVGQTVILNDDDKNPYKINGVIDYSDFKSHFQYDFVLTLEGKEFWEGEQSNWCCWNYDSYIQVMPGTDPKELEEKLLAIRDNYVVPYLRKRGDKRADIQQKFLSFELQPVADVYLRSQDIDDNLRHGDIRMVWLFGAIAGFILLIACINFINLSTAKSANRAKEVGLRKVMGSFRSDLIQQFLVESLLYSVISFVLGLLLAWFFLPAFNSLAEKTLDFPLFEWWLVPVVAVSAILIGVLAGMYPSLYLSAFKPISVLKGRLSKGSKGSSLRSSMVVFQFATSIILIICTMVTYQQMTYILNTEIGFDKEQVLMIQGAHTLEEKQKEFKTELGRLPKVRNVTISSALPVEGTHRNGNSFWKDGRSTIDQGIGAQIWRVDPDYMETLGMNLVEGRGFIEDLASDSSALIINQTMAKKLGLESPVGERIMNWETWTVVGVVEDFHFESMKGDIESLCFARGDFGSIVSIKVESSDMEETIASISSVWDDFMPNQPIRYTFLDHKYALMYQDVQRTSNVILVFAILAVVVACLGLFALSTFMLEQRSKEISIRKVLGASMGSIFNLVTSDFLKLVGIAFLISIPIGTYMMNHWLEDYSYRIDISWNVYVFAGGIALLIAFFTISAESLKAALKDPINSLRSE